MIYNVGRAFVKLEEFSGTVYNKSADSTLELSTKPENGSGTLILPNQSQSYRYQEMYVRCVDGNVVEVQCEPYDLDPSKRVDGDTFVEDGDYLHLTFDFPTGSNKTMLLRNPRPNLTVAELQSFSEYVIDQDIFRNDFSEPTLGLKKIMMIKSMVRGTSTDTTSGGGASSGEGGQIGGDDPEPIIVPDTVSTMDVDLRRRVKWRWLTRILPDSSFLDMKMYAAAEALDDQITLFHWAIKNVLHLPRLDELKGTVLDLLAYQFHVDAYDAINFTDAEKRELIRNSIAWHRIKGTPAAVDMILGVAFNNAHIAEWFEYGGDPYYFRLYIKGTAYSPGSFKSFWRMFFDAKNVRSHLDKVIIDLSPDEPIKIYTGIFKIKTGNRNIPLSRPLPLTTERHVYTGVFKVIGGNIMKHIFIAPPTTSPRKIYTGFVTFRTGSRTIGMYQPA